MLNWLCRLGLADAVDASRRHASHGRQSRPPLPADIQTVCPTCLLLFRVDESHLTGESDDVAKEPRTRPSLLGGSKILSGFGRMLVTAVGPNSQVGGRPQAACCCLDAAGCCFGARGACWSPLVGPACSCRAGGCCMGQHGGRATPAICQPLSPFSAVAAVGPHRGDGCGRQDRRRGGGGGRHGDGRG